VDLAIVRAIIDLAHAMGISAVAEGVETKDQAAELNMLGCPVGQGFYFSPPLPGHALDLEDGPYGMTGRLPGYVM
jgi:EAL domain-containing protein (putative c-di-GMP-specific phosphodiesterase class I)